MVELSLIQLWRHRGHKTRLGRVQLQWLHSYSIELTRVWSCVALECAHRAIYSPNTATASSFYLLWPDPTQQVAPEPA